MRWPTICAAVVAALTLLKQVGEHQLFNQLTKWVMSGFTGCGDRLNLSGVVDRHDSAEGVGRHLLDEGDGETVIRVGEKLLELGGIAIGAPIGQLSGGVYQGISSHSAGDPFMSAPTSDGVVIVES